MAKKKQLELRHGLVLNRFMLYLFGVNKFEAFAEHFNDSRNEGLDENNISKFYPILINRLFSNQYLNKDVLLEYDQNIVSHSQHINQEREEPITWKYFQYLGLMFTEIFMDKYFGNKYQLLEDINQFVEKLNDPFNKDVPSEYAGDFPKFEIDDLNKLAFWNATGSGKTLIMHVNILQALHYQKKYKQTSFENILLITPNEGLSKQHLKELKESSIESQIFTKSGGGLFAQNTVNVIEITKLADEMGDTTVAIEAFEQNNLVLIDEGHRGIAGDQWKRRRDWLSQKGMAIEYSATFGQAVSTTRGQVRKGFIEEYGKAILFDYSYKYFYQDGFGKDYRILNLPSDDQELILHKYMIGSLLSFYQQKLIWKENPTAENIYLIDNPLWVFVGGTVTAGYSKKNASDIVQILKFFRRFILNPSESKSILSEILSGREGLLDANNQSVFQNSFEYLNIKEWSDEAIYIDILKQLFNSVIPGAELYIDDLQGQDGELGIRIGNADYFGLINVGESGKLFTQLIENEDFKGVKKDFSTSLFQTINNKDSKINVLVGAKKFTEGWSSWRVSTMGLMNIGRSEGSTVIQLFGRGVRLKGYNFSLKRSTRLEKYEQPEVGVNPLIKPLETLNVFGIRADYMDQFKEILEEEGLPPNDKNYEEVFLPVMPHVDLDKHKLKLFRVREDVSFKSEQVIELKAHFFDASRKIKLDWYPKVQAFHSAGGNTMIYEQVQIGKLTEKHLNYFNWFEVYEEIIQFKNERSWYNISIEPSVLEEILQVNNWYELFIPEEDLKPTSYVNVARWQEIGVALLKAYIDKFYNYKKQDYLKDFIEVIEIDQNDPNFFSEYKVEIEQSQESIARQIRAVKEMIAQAELPDEVAKKDLPMHMNIFQFANHLYTPLIYISEKTYRNVIKISPVALNRGERDFVKDLKYFYENNTDFFEDKNLFLLRNTSRKGIGFFEANNFYPDFILWLVKGDKQYIGFVDPKGLRQVNGFENPKIKFKETIKTSIEPRVQKQDPNIFLSSFIVSATPFDQIKHWKGQDGISDFNKNNVYFLDNQKEVYIKEILKKMIR